MRDDDLLGLDLDLVLEGPDQVPIVEPAEPRFMLPRYPRRLRPKLLELWGLTTQLVHEKREKQRKKDHRVRVNERSIRNQALADAGFVFKWHENVHVERVGYDYKRVAIVWWCECGADGTAMPGHFERSNQVHHKPYGWKPGVSAAEYTEMLKQQEAQEAVEQERLQKLRKMQAQERQDLRERQGWERLRLKFGDKPL